MGAAAVDAAADDDAAAGAAAVEGGDLTVIVTVAVDGVEGGVLTGTFGTALTTSAVVGIMDPALEDSSSVTGPRVFESKM